MSNGELKAGAGSATRAVNDTERAIVTVFNRLGSIGDSANRLADSLEELSDRMGGAHPREVPKKPDSQEPDGMIQILHHRAEVIEGQLERISLALKTCEETA